MSEHLSFKISWEQQFRLDGQVALITGAVGQLGRQFSRVLGSAGAIVVVSDLELERCQEYCNLLRSEGIQALPLALDVTQQKDVQMGFEWVVRQVGRLDVLVNNAGIAVFSPFEERTFDEFMQVLTVNVAGTFLCTQAAVRIMKNQPAGGRIINIGSIYGLVSDDPRIYTDCSRNPSEVYSASKAAVIQMTRYWAVHLAKYNIRVNAISPGGVFNQQGADFVKNYSYRTPLGRMAREDELNAALLFLASDASSYVTGHNLVVDGGWTAW
jgi:NAD(P)-dependent dehydrogenase (short-subunit alcohol dehydrogenase family)